MKCSPPPSTMVHPVAAIRPFSATAMARGRAGAPRTTPLTSMGMVRARGSTARNRSGRVESRPDRSATARRHGAERRADELPMRADPEGIPAAREELQPPGNCRVAELLEASAVDNHGAAVVLAIDGELRSASGAGAPGDAHTELTGDQREDVRAVDVGVVDPSAPLARNPDEKGYRSDVPDVRSSDDARLVVRAEARPVIGRHHDHGTVVQADLLETLNQAADQAIQELSCRRCR